MRGQWPEWDRRLHGSAITAAAIGGCCRSSARRGGPSTPGRIGPGGFEPPLTDPKSAVLPLDEGPVPSAGKVTTNRASRWPPSPEFRHDELAGGSEPSLAWVPRWGYRFVGQAQLQRRMTAPKSLIDNAIPDAWRAGARPGICSRRSRNVASSRGLRPGISRHKVHG